MAIRSKLAVAGLCACVGLAACSGVSEEPGFEATVRAGPDDGIDGDIGYETPADQTGRYSCGGVAITIDELENLAGLPAPDPTTFDLVSGFSPLGPVENWGVLASGWLVDRRPLESSGFTGVVLVDPQAGAPTPCVPVTTLEPPTAWRRPGPLVAPGGPSGAALAAARCSAEATAEGITVYWWDLPVGASWEVWADGTNLIGGMVEPATVVNDVLQAAFTERMASYGVPIPDGAPGRTDPGTAAGPGAEAEPVSPQGVFSDFGALGAPLGVARTYEMRLTASGGAIHVLPCGSAAIPTELPTPPCTLSLFAGHPQIELDAGGGTPYAPDLLTVFRDGEPLTLGNQWGPPIDVTTEPGSTHRYEVEVRDRMLGRPPVTVDCGSITASIPADDSEELRAGAELFKRVLLGPYLYARAENDGRMVDLVMQFAGTGFAFAPGHPADDSLDPYTVHDRLLAAIAEGREVTFEIDPPTGLPRSWTIDGVVRAYHCVTTDTQPPDMRPSTACDETYDRLDPAS
ncbi:MAG: hypothetical protein R2761_06295 [Acidimicrobiales bacterium]